MSGMTCPSCGKPGCKTYDSRVRHKGRQISRRRQCLSCGARFTTTETVLGQTRARATPPGPANEQQEDGAIGR